MTPTTELAEKLEAIPTADMTLEDQKIFALGIQTLRKQAEELERCRTALRPFARLADDDVLEVIANYLSPLTSFLVFNNAAGEVLARIELNDLRLARSAYNEPKQNGEKS